MTLTPEAADWLGHGILVGLLWWFMRRLVAQLDAALKELRVMQLDIARIQERHELEDRAGVRPPASFALPGVPARARSEVR